jgi:hypothetical protein
MKRISPLFHCHVVGLLFFLGAGALALIPGSTAGASSPVPDAGREAASPPGLVVTRAEISVPPAPASYYGFEVGNYQEMVSGKSEMWRMDIVRMDTTYPEPPFVVETQKGGSLYATQWYQDLSGAIGLKREDASGRTMVFAAPLVYLKEPVAEGDAWSSGSSLTFDGVTGTATLDAEVRKRKLVKTPAGQFLAYPINYSLWVKGPAGENAASWTEWFVPYIGSVKSTGSHVTLTAFGIGGGTLTLPPPVVSKISPSSGVPGDSIVVTGYHFQGVPGQVMIGGTASQVLSWSDGEIELVVPAGASSGPVLVVTPEWESNDSILFQVNTPPEITGVSPSTAAPGEQVTLQGKNFGVKKGKVAIGNLKAAVPGDGWGTGAIVCTVPKKLGPGTYDITVTTKFGTDLLPAGLFVPQR